MPHEGSQRAVHGSRVAVLGASPKPDRYSNRAVRMLLANQFLVIPVNPAHTVIEGLPTVSSLSEIAQPVDTLTVYLSPELSRPLADAIKQLAPRRVILNPGAEDAALAEELRLHGIEVVEACTLVMLTTGQF